jgi:putative (di)nucleoside polyphosphate hydrolase
LERCHGPTSLTNLTTPQRWFALGFKGEDAEIHLNLDPHPEFDCWRWAPLAHLPGLAVLSRRPIYDVLAREFAG